MTPQTKTQPEPVLTLLPPYTERNELPTHCEHCDESELRWKWEDGKERAYPVPIYAYEFQGLTVTICEPCKAEGRHLDE